MSVSSARVEGRDSDFMRWVYVRVDESGELAAARVRRVRRRSFCSCCGFSCGRADEFSDGDVSFWSRGLAYQNLPW